MSPRTIKLENGAVWVTNPRRKWWCPWRPKNIKIASAVRGTITVDLNLQSSESQGLR